MIHAIDLMPGDLAIINVMVFDEFKQRHRMTDVVAVDRHERDGLIEVSHTEQASEGCNLQYYFKTAPLDSIND